MAAAELVVLPRALAALAAMARMTGKYSGSQPAMTALTATFSTVYSQASRKCVGRMWPTTSSGLWLVAASIVRDALFGRQHDGQHVGPVVVEEQLVQIGLGLRLDQPRRGPLEDDLLQLVGVRRAASGPR